MVQLEAKDVHKVTQDGQRCSQDPPKIIEKLIKSMIQHLLGIPRRESFFAKISRPMMTLIAPMISVSPLMRCRATRQAEAK